MMNDVVIAIYVKKVPVWIINQIVRRDTEERRVFSAVEESGVSNTSQIKAKIWESCYKFVKKSFVFSSFSQDLSGSSGDPVGALYCWTKPADFKSGRSN